MKPIHKVAGKKNLRTEYNYIQVKGGFVYATNGYVAIKSPIADVFPEETIKEGEELYFNAELWASSKMDKAVFVERDGLIFTAKDKNKSVIGVIKAIDEQEMRGIARYPDINVIAPTGDAIEISAIALDPFLIADLCSAFAAENKQFIFNFYGVEKILILSHVSCKSVGYIMPLQGIITNDYADLL
jgi:hypothetical protein